MITWLLHCSEFMSMLRIELIVTQAHRITHACASMPATLLLHPQSSHDCSNHICYISCLEHWLQHPANALHTADNNASPQLRDDEQLLYTMKRMHANNTLRSIHINQQNTSPLSAAGQNNPARRATRLPQPHKPCQSVAAWHHPIPRRRITW